MTRYTVYPSQPQARQERYDLHIHDRGQFRMQIVSGADTFDAQFHPLVSYINFIQEGSRLETNVPVYAWETTPGSPRQVHVNVANHWFRAGIESPWESIVGASPGTLTGPHTVCAPMHGKVLKLTVTPPGRVNQSQTLLMIEAMKMENHITAPILGILSEFFIKEGDQVTQGQALCVIEPLGEQVKKLPPGIH